VFSRGQASRLDGWVGHVQATQRTLEGGERGEVGGLDGDLRGGEVGRGIKGREGQGPGLKSGKVRGGRLKEGEAGRGRELGMERGGLDAVFT
jgi:hypothetical protein